MRRFSRGLPLLILLLACGPKKYVLLSPEDNYSDDPSLTVAVGQVVEVTKGRTEVTLDLENKGATPLDIGGAQATLGDPDEKPMPLLGKPAGQLAPGAPK